VRKGFFFEPPLNHRLKQELNLLREEYRFPGATCAYILPDGTIGEVAVGWHDVEAKIPMTPRSRMLAASIGKIFVAAVVLQLVQEGKLHLEDSISRWLSHRPWFNRLPNYSTITISHLLTHSSGLPNHVHMQSFLQAYSRSWQSPSNPFSPEKLIAFVLDQPPLFEAGKGWMYTDTGYIVLGLIIEEATHSNYYNELEERLLHPLHLDETAPSNELNIPHLAAGYTKVDNPLGVPVKTTTAADRMAWNPAMEWTGGGLVSTSSDLARWAKLLYEGDAMQGNYLADLLRAVPVKEEAGLFYGAGVAISTKDSLGVVYGHMGVIPGYTSSMRYFPEYRVVCAFQVNTDIGVWDHSTQMVGDMEKRLAEVVFQNLKEKRGG
jgi:D-alanyl-D-alanine carboxypeptidase